MSSVAIVWLIVGLVSTAALLATLIALVRHLLVLARALGRFRDEVQPAAEDIAGESQRVSDRRSRLTSGSPFGRS